MRVSRVMIDVQPTWQKTISRIMAVTVCFMSSDKPLPPATSTCLPYHRRRRRGEQIPSKELDLRLFFLRFLT